MNYRLFFLALRGKIRNLNNDKLTEVYKHLEYLGQKANVDTKHILSGKKLNTEAQIIDDAITNINSVMNINNKKNTLLEPNSYVSTNERVSPIYLGGNLILCKMRWGGYVVCPTWNVDVSVGLIKEGIHEEALTKFILDNVREGENFINVGSNFGYYTVMAATKVGYSGKVYGFEANPITFTILMKTLHYSGYYDTIEIYNRAVSKETGLDLSMDFDYQYIGGGSIMYDSIDKNEGMDSFWNENSIHHALDTNGKYRKGFCFYQKINTKTIKLDDALDCDNIDWILCDAECADPLVILSAKRIISNSPEIRIIFEWSSNNYQLFDDEYKNDIKEMWDFLYSEGFVIKHIEPALREGQVVFGDELSYDDFINNCEHGDYFAYRMK